MKKGVIFVSVVLCLVLTTGAAFALDLTGTWKGGWRCKGFDGEKVSAVAENVTLTVTQQGNDLYMFEDAAGSSFYGLLIEDLEQPNKKGEIIWINCDTNTDLSTDIANNVWNEMGRMKVTIRCDKAIMRGTFITGGDEDGYSFVLTCREKFIRIDTDDPGVSPCP